MKMKARFRRPGTTKEVHCYYDRCLTCAKCKPRAKPRAPLWSFTSGNPMQRIHIDIVAPLPRSRRGNRYILTVQCSLTNRAEVFAMSNQRATTSAKVLVRNWICSCSSTHYNSFLTLSLNKNLHFLNINTLYGANTDLVCNIRNNKFYQGNFQSPKKLPLCENPKFINPTVHEIRTAS